MDISRDGQAPLLTDVDKANKQGVSLKGIEKLGLLSLLEVSVGRSRAQEHGPVRAGAREQRALVARGAS